MIECPSTPIQSDNHESYFANPVATATAAAAAATQAESPFMVGGATPYFTAPRSPLHQHQEFFNAIQSRYAATDSSGHPSRPIVSTSPITLQPPKLRQNAPSAATGTSGSSLPFKSFKPEELGELVDRHKESILMIDVRSFVHYSHLHIQDAINVSIPNTILKRPSFTLDKVSEVIVSDTQRAVWSAWADKKYIVLYDQISSNLIQNQPNAIVYLCNKFVQSNYRGSLGYLEGKVLRRLWGARGREVSRLHRRPQSLVLFHCDFPLQQTSVKVVCADRRGRKRDAGARAFPETTETLRVMTDTRTSVQEEWQLSKPYSRIVAYDRQQLLATAATNYGLRIAFRWHRDSPASLRLSLYHPCAWTAITTHLRLWVRCDGERKVCSLVVFHLRARSQRLACHSITRHLTHSFRTFDRIWSLATVTSRNAFRFVRHHQASVKSTLQPVKCQTGHCDKSSASPIRPLYLHGYMLYSIRKMVPSVWQRCTR